VLSGQSVSSLLLSALSLVLLPGLLRRPISRVVFCVT